MNRTDIHNSINFKIDHDHIVDLIDKSLSAFGESACFVELNFISKVEMGKINKSYRKIDKPTDVLSFPQTETPNSKIKLLGDIVISPDVVAGKKEKMDDVVKHGLLHLLGFDHETDEIEWVNAAQKINCQY